MRAVRTPRRGPAAGGVLAIAMLLIWSVPADGDVTVKGHVYYWDLTRSAWHTESPQNIPGRTYYSLPMGTSTLQGYLTCPSPGEYVPARQTLVQVEFSGPNNDEQVFTDDDGAFSVGKRNPKVGGLLDPWSRHYDVAVEVRASVRLGTADGNAFTVDCYSGHTSIYPYNGQMSSRRVGPDQTIEVDIYIGGPRQNLAEWDYDDNGQHTHEGLFLCQCCLDAYRYLVSPGTATAWSLKRNTNIIYMKDSHCYKPDWFRSGIVGTIFMGEVRLRPDQMQAELLHNDSKALADHWNTCRGIMTHEYGHKIMHDVYWAWPRPSAYEHNIGTCKTPELGWTEGWANFFAAAVVGWPTIEGQRGSQAPHIEHAWHPNPVGLADAKQGTYDWRDTLEKPSLRHWNEGEVAGVLWDIHDPADWEYMLQAQQDAKPANWPAPLRWRDRLSDPKLEVIWGLLEKHDPDCLMDEGDIFWEDGFWYYWRRKYPDDEHIHALKAILYNRGITSSTKPQHAPSLELGKTEPETRRITVSITEVDAEDRPFLYYNIAYAYGSGAWKLMHTEDQPLNPPWNGPTASVVLALPNPGEWDRLIVMVHDSMQCAFLEYPQGAGGGARVHPRRAPLAASTGTLFLKPDGTIWFCGSYHNANVGRSLLVAPPQQVPSTAPKPVALAMHHTRSTYYVICQDGSLWGWSHEGLPYYLTSRLSLRDAGRRTSPVPLAGLVGIVKVAAGVHHVLALRGDGTVWSWGSNTDGQLGRGTKPASGVRQVALPEAVVDLAAGDRHSLALGKGKLWAWGANTYGQVGDGTQTDRHEPVAVNGPLNAKAVACGGSHSLAIDSRHRVWAWGRNESGQLGDGTTTDRAVPTPVVDLDKRRILAVAGGGRTSFALDDAGQVWAWGRHGGSLLGLGREASGALSRPTPIKGLSDIHAIVAGESVAFAIGRDGTVWGWGASLEALGEASKGGAPVPIRLESFGRLRIR